MKHVIVLFVAAVVSVACWNRHVNAQIVCLLDASASIPKEVRRTIAAALVGMAETLQRGDELIVIPITGESVTDTPGHIQRFKLSLQREPYEADRRKLRESVRVMSESFGSEISNNPYSQTDLIGAFALGAEEFRVGTAHRFICLSDFIQDDKQFDFRNDASLGDPEGARRAALRVAKSRAGFLEGSDVYLGLVQSSEMRRLTRSRQAGIQAFWVEFLKAQGAKVRWKTDGLGQISDFIAKPGVAVMATENSAGQRSK